jgi:predicted ATPase
MVCLLPTVQFFPLRSFSTLYCLKALVLDDIQWMDQESRIVIKMLMEAEEELKNVMLILLYRDEEEEKVLDLFFQDQTREPCLNIALENLELITVN